MGRSLSHAPEGGGQHIRPIPDRDDLVRSMEEEEAIQRLILAGLDNEAELLSAKIRLMDQFNVGSEEELATVLRKAGVEGDLNAILADRIGTLRDLRDRQEDINRLADAYSQSVDDARRTFEDFLGDLQGAKPGNALKALGNNLIQNYRDLQTRILSEKLFGGIERELDRMIREQLGKQTADEKLDQRAKALGTSFDTVGSAAEQLIDAMLRQVARLDQPAMSSATAAVRSPVITGGALETSSSLLDLRSFLGDVKSLNGEAMEDLAAALGRQWSPTAPTGDDITVTGQREAADRQIEAANDNERAALKMMSAIDALDFVNTRLIQNLERQLGIVLPGTLPSARRPGCEQALPGGQGCSQPPGPVERRGGCPPSTRCRSVQQAVSRPPKPAVFLALLRDGPACRCTLRAGRTRGSTAPTCPSPGRSGANTTANTCSHLRNGGFLHVPRNGQGANTPRCEHLSDPIAGKTTRLRPPYTARGPEGPARGRLGHEADRARAAAGDPPGDVPGGPRLGHRPRRPRRHMRTASQAGRSRRGPG